MVAPWAKAATPGRPVLETPDYLTSGNRPSSLAKRAEEWLQRRFAVLQQTGARRLNAKYIVAGLTGLILLAGNGVVLADGPRLKIVVSGVKGELKANVYANLSLKQRQAAGTVLDEQAIRRLHRKAEQEIRLALQPFGYYRPAITSSLTTGADGWVASYRIVPGSAIKLSRVEVVLRGPGADDPVLKAWRQRFPLHRGSTLRQQAYESAKSELLQLLQGRGYLERKLERHEIVVDLSRYSATIDLAIDTGPRYRFGAVEFQQDILKESLLKQYLPFHPGDNYDADKLLELQRALSNSGYYQRINIQPLLDQAVDRRIPVTVLLEPRKPTRYTTGIGYGTDTGPRVSFGVERRYHNRLGYKISGDVKVSEIRQEGTLRYRIPLDRPQSDYSELIAASVNEQTATSSRRTRRIGISANHKLRYLQRTVAITYEMENYNIAGETDYSALLIPLVSLQYLKADSRIHTRKGVQARLTLKGATEQILSNTSFIQTRFGTSFIRSIGNHGRLIARAEIGVSWLGELDELPASQRFFTGGDRSVRGYRYASLGPVDSRGRTIGGKHLLTGTIEYELPVSKNLALAAFFDTGNAFNSFNDFTLKQSAGFGLHWFLPVGTLRLDLASPFQEEDRPWRIHLSIGPDM